MRLSALWSFSGAGRATGASSTRASGGFVAQAVLIGVLSAGLLALTPLYETALRDARYFDGWVLGIGMIVQAGFHVALKSARLAPKTVMRWRALHIMLGYVLIAAFLSHTDFGMPDTPFEWALWGGFALVVLSGALGTYLAWSLKSRHGIDAGFNFDRITERRAALARAVHAAVTEVRDVGDDLALPALPYHAWILDLYANQLRDFFQGPRNVRAHLIGSQEPLKRLIAEIETLARFVDAEGQEKLSSLKDFVREKDRLDFACVHTGLTRGWLYVHVPVTYSLVVLSVLHGIAVYAYSSDAW